jgi:outer membrane protein assembly factor BamB
MSGWTLAIDVGTHTVVAAVDTGTGARVLTLAPGGPLPALVATSPFGDLRTGNAAAEIAALTPDLAETRCMQALATQATVRLGNRDIATEDLVAALITVAVRAGTVECGGPPQRLILVHPPRWGTTERDRLTAAGQRAAGIPPHLVASPVAAARRYAAAHPVAPGAHVAVLDLGTELRTAVLHRTRSGFTLAGPPGGDPDLGGEALTGHLFDLVAGYAREQDPDAWTRMLRGGDPAAQSRFHTDLTALAATLCDQTTATITGPGQATGIRITRPEYEDRIRPVLTQCAAEVRATAQQAGVPVESLAGIYLTGAAARTPAVSAVLTEALGVVPIVAADTKTVAVLGALTHVWMPADPPPAPAVRSSSSSYRAGREPKAGPLPAGTTPGPGATPAAGWRPWRAPIGGTGTVLAYAGETVFAAGTQVTAVDAYAGTGRWTSPPVPPLQRLELAGTTVIGHDGTRILALDRTGGAPRWAYQATGPMVPGPGVLHVAAKRALICIDVDSGRESWRTATDADTCGLAVPGDGRCYLTTVDGRLTAADEMTGAPLWQARLPAGSAGPAVMSGAVHVAGPGGPRAFDAETGEPLWHAPGGEAGTVLVQADLVYVAGRGVAAYDVATGTPRWRTGAGNSFSGLPAVGEGVVCGPAGDTLAVFDAVTGRPRAAIRGAAQPVLADGLAYVTVHNGRHLGAVDLGTGAMRWQAALPGTMTAGPVLAAGLVFALVREGSGTHLYAIDARTGAFSGSVG